MLSIAFSSGFRDFKGIQDHFSLRGFSTLDAGSGEGFGRSFFHEDIKKEKRIVSIQAAPKSIDEIVLPFFVSKGRGIERALQNAAYNSMPDPTKSTLQQVAQNYAQLSISAPFTPSLAFDVKAAQISYARTLGAYSSQRIEEYAAATTEPQERIATPSPYAAGTTPQVVVPPMFAEKISYLAHTKTPVYTLPLPSQPYAAAVQYVPVVPRVRHVLVSAIERSIAYERIAAPSVAIPMPLNVPRPIATIPHLPYQSLVQAVPKEVPSVPVTTEKHYARQTYQFSSNNPVYRNKVSSLQSPAIRAEPRSEISSVLEPRIIAKSSPQPRTVEKIKRELPKYERIAYPTELEGIASDIESKYGCTVSFKIINKTKRYTFGRGDETVIPPASVSKLGIVYAAMTLAQEGKLDLEQRIDVKKMLDEHPHLRPQNIGNLKESYTKREMLREIVTDENRSSNPIANALLYLLGKDEVNRLLAKGGFTHTSFASDAPYTPKGEYHHNTTTSEEASLLMGALTDTQRWSAYHQRALQGILEPSKNWVPFLFGQEAQGRITLKAIKHGQTENAVSVVYEGMDDRGNHITGMVNIAGIRGRMVDENYRRATKLGIQVMNDYVKLSRAAYHAYTSAPFK